MRVAILGLGEAGALYTEGLVGVGVEVSAFDPVAASTPAGVRREGSTEAAVAGADFVVSLVGAAASAGVLAAALAGMDADAVFMDLNTGAPEHKAELASVAAAAGVIFADVAVMAPVPRAGVLTPLLVSGAGAERVASAWGQLGIPITDVGPTPGSAAGLKMLRSVFMKGLAALVFESVAAGDKAGSGEWLKGQIAGELGPDGAALVERLIDGTRAHAVRREHEMLDARGYLEGLGSPTWMTEGTLAWLHALAENPSFAEG